jgi:hypothetical protein
MLTHSLVAIGDTSVNDTDLGSLAENAELVEPVDAGGVVGGVAQGSRAVGLLSLDGRELDLLVQPDLDNVGEGGQGVGVELLGLDADAGEDVTLKSPENLDAGGAGDLLLALPERAL